jgi:hypothetical protein
VRSFIYTLLFIANIQAFAQTTPYTNGEVRTIANYGDTVFVGGSFSKVYSYEQSSEKIAFFDTLTGQHIAAKLRTNGDIRKIIRDENGTGFYVGGTFTTINDSTRSGVAHIDATGNVTARLRKWKMASPFCTDLVLRGDSLIASGSFNRIFADSLSQTDYLKGIGTLTAANDHSGLPHVNGEIYTMVVDGMGARYLCGNFTRVGNQTRNRLAKIDSNGNVLPWHPIVQLGDVRTLLLNGNTIILGGRFELINGQLRRSVAEVDTISGTTNTSLSVNVMQYGNVSNVYSMARWLNTLILAGDFSHVGDSARQNIAVVDLATSRATSRIINVSGTVSKILVSGNQLFAGGNIYGVNGDSRNAIFSMNLSTGVLSTLSIWPPSLSGSSFIANDLVLNGTTLYVAGLTFPINGSVANVGGVVAINTGTGSITTQFTVPRDQQVTRLALHQGLLYASGNFTQMNANPRSGLASITVSNNTLTGSFVTNTLLNKMLLGGSGNRILLSAISLDGCLIFNNNTTNTGLLGYHTTSDSMFTFNHQIIGRINSLLLTNDTLFVGGLFTIYGRNRGADSTRISFAAIDLSSYNLLSPSLGSIALSATVNAMVKYDNSIILGGNFPLRPSGIVGFNLATLSDNIFSRPQTGTVNQMCLVNNQLYLAGNFTLLGNSIGLISTSANFWGNNTTWNIDYNWCSAIFNYQNKLYAYGTYTFNGEPLREMRTFNLPSNPAFAPTLIAVRNQNVPAGDVLSFVGAGNRIIAAGSFAFVGSEIPARGFLAYQRSTGKVIMQNLSLNTDGVINSFARFGQTLYIGGGFDSINAIARRGLASVNLNTGTVNAWNPATVPIWVNTLHVTDSNLWVGGSFSTIAGQQRNGLAVFNSNTLTLRSGVTQLNANAQVVFIKSNANHVFIGGGIDSVGGVYIHRLASFNRATLAVNTNWKPYLNNSIGSGISQMEVINNHVYVFRPNNQLLKISATSGLPDSVWTAPTFNVAYRSILPYRSGLLLMGTTSYLIDTVQGNQSPLVLSSGDLNSFAPFGIRVNTGIILGDNLICGGWFINGLYKKHLSEYSLAGNDMARMETSRMHICKSRDFTIGISSIDTLNTKEYIVQINGMTLGLLSLPSKPSLTFRLPSSISPGSFNTLTLVSSTSTLQASRTIIVGDPASKVLQTSQTPTLCTGQSLSIFFSDSTNRTTDTYKWYRNDTLISGANQYMLTGITAPGSYKSIVETPANCIDTTATIAVTQTGLCQAPTLSAHSLKFKNITPTSVVVFWKNGNGARRIVIAKADSAVNASPTYGVSYNASLEYGIGDSLGFKNYVVYNGTGNEALLIGIIPGKTYHFAVVEYNETGQATSYQSGPYLTGRLTMPVAQYYNKTTGNLNALATWGTNTNGTGTSPSSFSTPAIYWVRNNTTPTISANWELDSISSVVRIETGGFPGTPIQCSIPTGFYIQCGNLSVNGNHILTVSGELKSQFVEGLDTSLCVWNGTATQTIPESKFGRLTLSGGQKLASGKIWVTDTLRLGAIVRMQGDTFTLGTQFFPFGPLVRTNGFIEGPMNRWIRNIITTGTNGLLPTGRENKYMPLQFNFTSTPSGTGNVLITAHAVAAVPGNGGLPRSESGVSITTAGRNGYWRTANTLNRSGISFTFIAGANNYNGVNNHLTTRLIFRNPGDNWQTFGTAGVVAGNTSAFTITKTNTSLFGEFAIGADSNANPLPVEFISFTASKQPDYTVLLNWQTANEINNAHFEVERSDDAIQFSTIAIVKGNGTTSTLSNYQHIDNESAMLLQSNKNVYYRLKQVDVDGSYAYSNILAVFGNDTENDISVYPNPAHSYIHIEGLLKDAALYDIVGNKIMNIPANEIVDVNALSAGIYFIRFEGKSIKLIKY